MLWAVSRYLSYDRYYITAGNRPIGASGDRAIWLVRGGYRRGVV
jgi:hypothetical protein